MAKYFIKWFALWITIWAVFWILFGTVVSQNVHFPFSGVFSPIIGPVVLVSGIFTGGAFSMVALEELYIPSIVFWGITALIHAYLRNKQPI